MLFIISGGDDSGGDDNDVHSDLIVVEKEKDNN